MQMFSFITVLGYSIFDGQEFCSNGHVITRQTAFSEKSFVWKAHSHEFLPFAPGSHIIEPHALSEAYGMLRGKNLPWLIWITRNGGSATRQGKILGL